MKFTCKLCGSAFTRMDYINHLTTTSSKCCEKQIDEPKQNPTSTPSSDFKEEDQTAEDNADHSISEKEKSSQISEDTGADEAIFMVINLNTDEFSDDQLLDAVMNDEVNFGRMDESEVEPLANRSTDDLENDAEANHADEDNFGRMDESEVEPLDNRSMNDFENVVEENHGDEDHFGRMDTSQVELLDNRSINDLENDAEENPADEDEEAAGMQDGGNLPDIPLTKKGNPRKRAARKDPNTKKSKLQKQQEKHPLQIACNEERCNRKCTTKISENRRKNIHEQFWCLEENERKLFILGNVKKENVKRRMTKNQEDSRRSRSFVYHLSDENGDDYIVCKTFFLATLGYLPKNDKSLFNVLSQSDMTPKRDERGKHSPPNKLDEDIIKKHVLTYNPCVSHYRREHAPLRKYLPAEVTIVSMYNDFKKLNPRLKCSYDKYRSVVSGMHISFARLGHEECEKCEIQKNHNVDHFKEPDDSCDQCKSYLAHKEKYILARTSYQSHAEKANNGEVNDVSGENVVFSMDLQKVLMLPMMEQFKEAIFTKRIVVFHESFVPLGTRNESIKPIAVIWHEGCSGRKKEDITSAMHSFFLHNRDATNISLWMDNCAAQNKNWAMFSYLSWLVNSTEIKAKSIELNYLESGHTFMSADHFHHQVTKELRQKGKVYDFDDFSEAVQNSNSRNVTVCKLTEPSDFFAPFDFSSLHTIGKTEPRPYLSDMVQVVFKRGSLNLLYKVSFSDEEFIELKYLKVNYLKKGSLKKPPFRTTTRGINQSKQEDIIKKLVPLMPETRRHFWTNLKVSEVPDLLIGDD